MICTIKAFKMIQVSFIKASENFEGGGNVDLSDVGLSISQKIKNNKFFTYPLNAMNKIEKLSASSLGLLNKLIVAKDIYQELYPGLSDTLLRIELKRIIIEKEIFIKDFNAVNGFTLKVHLEEYGDDIKLEADNLRIKLNHLMPSNNNHKIFSIILQREKELVELYHIILRKTVTDEFVYMILKNQLDETKQSVRELSEILDNVIVENIK